MSSTVGSSPTPSFSLMSPCSWSSSTHAQILEVAKEILAKDNITLEIVPYDDYVLPNTNVEDGQLDANYFQHITYMNNFNTNDGTPTPSFSLMSPCSWSSSRARPPLVGSSGMAICAPSGRASRLALLPA